jgi:hypothetical protein
MYMYPQTPALLSGVESTSCLTRLTSQSWAAFANRYRYCYCYWAHSAHARGKLIWPTRTTHYPYHPHYPYLATNCCSALGLQFFVGVVAAPGF